MFVSVMLFSLLYTSSSTYAYDKLLRFVVLNGIAYVSVFILFIDDRSKLLNVFLYASLIMAVAGIITFILNRYAGIGGFVSVFGSNYLALGRMCGIGTIICMCKLHEKIKLITCIQIIVLLIGIFITGGKTPAIAFIIVFVVYMLSLIKVKNLKIIYNSRIKVLMIATAVFVVLLVAISFTGVFSTLSYRMQDLKNTKQSASYTDRMDRYSVAFESWGNSPVFGNGIGSFGIIFAGEDLREYPHNIVLEILTELGLMGLLAFSLLLIYPITKCIKYKKMLLNIQWYQIAIALVFIYMLINSFVSGDLNDNRLLFTFIALMWID
jgi:O-antigen ligase